MNILHNSCVLLIGHGKNHLKFVFLINKFLEMYFAQILDLEVHSHFETILKCIYNMFLNSNLFKSLFFCTNVY